MELSNKFNLTIIVIQDIILYDICLLNTNTKQGKYMHSLKDILTNALLKRFKGDKPKSPAEMTEEETAHEIQKHYEFVQKEYEKFALACKSENICLHNFMISTLLAHLCLIKASGIGRENAWATYIGCWEKMEDLFKE